MGRQLPRRLILSDDMNEIVGFEIDKQRYFWTGQKSGLATFESICPICAEPFELAISKINFEKMQATRRCKGCRSKKSGRPVKVRTEVRASS